MKAKFKNASHKTRFTEFIAENVKHPYKSSFDSTGCRTVSPKGGARTRRQQSETGYIAAVFLLSVDKLLWSKSQSALTSYSVDFKCIDLSGISTEGYALFKAAKSIYLDKNEIAFNELCDCELIDEAVVITILTGILVFRNGIDILNWRI